MNIFKGISLLVTILCLAKTSVCQQYDDENSYDGDNYSAENDASSEGSSEDSGFVTPLDFSPLFGGGNFGLSEAASNPVADVFQKAPETYHSLFDAGGAESQTILGAQDFFQGQASDKTFAPESFGFLPQFSQGLGLEPVPQPNRYQHNAVHVERTQATAKSSALTRAPLNFDIKTKHDKVYKKNNHPDSSSRASSTSYTDKSKYDNKFATPTVSEYKTVHQSDTPSALNTDEYLGPYKKYSFQPQDVQAAAPAYQPLTGNAFAGSYPNYAQLSAIDPKIFRYKRYSGNKKNAKARKAKESGDGESSYDYSADYKSKPKQFDESPSYESPDFSGYGDKEALKQFDYGSDEEYGSDEYDRIKSLSEEQAADVKKNPENCKKVQRDSMTCTVCQNPKNGGSYESCSYVSEPKNNKYAYVKEQKFDSDDVPEGQAASSGAQELKKSPEKSQPLKSVPATVSAPVKQNYEVKHSRGGARFQQPQNKRRPQREPEQKFGNYYGGSSQATRAETRQPLKFAAYQQEESEEDDDDDEDDNEYDGREKEDRRYEYTSHIPGFFTDTEPKRNVEHVLAEFAKKDRSACKKVIKNDMTCYQCTDKTGLKHEECMFVSESAPVSSHLAYKEVKEFNSKPEEKNVQSDNSHEAESKIVTTSKPAPAGKLFSVSSTAIPEQKKKQPFKKYTSQDDLLKKGTARPGGLFSGDKAAALNVEAPTVASIVKRDVKKKVRSTKAPPKYETPPSASSKLDDIANPTEFAGEESKGAFWAETVPKYSKTLGVSLPEYMLAKSEHETQFDKALSSGK